MPQTPPSSEGDVDIFYEHYYSQVLRRGLVGRAQDRTHKALERPWSSRDRFERVLEVGAGTGDHLRFVRHEFHQYVQTDIRSPGGDLIEAKTERSLSDNGRTIFQVADAHELPFPDDSFDRLISTCLLLHLGDPEAALRDWRRVVRPGGWVTMLMPCEPGLLLRFSRRVMTAPKVKRLGYVGYGLFNARDHRNHAAGLRQMIHHVFKFDQVKERRYPFRLPSWNINLYFVYQIKIKDDRELGRTRTATRMRQSGLR